jgi:hypothetical protein
LRWNVGPGAASRRNRHDRSPEQIVGRYDADVRQNGRRNVDQIQAEQTPAGTVVGAGPLRSSPQTPSAITLAS